MTVSMEKWPSDSRGIETEMCFKQMDRNDLNRFAEIANQDLDIFCKQRPELKGLRICSILGESGADHYVKGGGFRCLSVWTFFKIKTGIRNYHPLRSVRIDFGNDKFGHSSWIKHPGDKGFSGRGINCYGRSIGVNEGESIDQAMTRYLRNDTSQGAERLKKSAVVVLWPPERIGDILWNGIESGNGKGTKRKLEETEVVEVSNKRFKKI